jgi:hydroxymethylbilane synthase
VGTTSLRRRALLLRHRPDLAVVDLRGNVDTRLRRRREGDFDAVVLAMAGLVRLGRASEGTEPLDPEQFVPAPGQGAIGLETRADDAAVRDAIAALHHEPTARAVTAERTLLASLGGGCNVPLGAFARPSGKEANLRLTAFVSGGAASAFVEASGEGADPVELGTRVAAALLGHGVPAVP